MNIVLFGPPGSGKGTQSKFIIDKYNLFLISPGEILRNYIKKNNNELSVLINRFIQFGCFVPDNIVINVVNKYLSEHSFKDGYLFDGFPRNVSQAMSIDYLNIDVVIEFYLSRKFIIDRLLGRRIHLNSGRIYHVKYFPPKINGIDDITGEKLIVRNDDLLNIINNRLYLYYNELLSLRNFYKNKIFNIKVNSNCKYYIINSGNDCKKINSKIFKILDSVL